MPGTARPGPGASSAQAAALTKSGGEAGKGRGGWSFGRGEVSFGGFFYTERVSPFICWVHLNAQFSVACVEIILFLEKVGIKFSQSYKGCSYGNLY